MVKLSKKVIKQMQALAKETGYVDTDSAYPLDKKALKVQLSSLYGSTVQEPDKYLGGTTYEEL